MRFFTATPIVLGFLTVSIMPAPAHAQDGSVGLNLTSTNTLSRDTIDVVSVDFDGAFNIIDNPYLSDMVKLNYQISLLDKMVARQAELQKISESYASMGIKYTPPPPPRGICVQLPTNAACLKAYPDLYSDLINERHAHYDELAAKVGVVDANTESGESAEEAAARLAKEDAIRREKEAKAERHARYQWTDISCSIGICHGVLIASNMNGYRTTVHDGSKLSDGTTVEAVSAEGIRITIDGEVIRVRPAPSDGSNEQKTLSPQDAISAIINNQKQGADVTAATATPTTNTKNTSGGTTSSRSSGTATGSQKTTATTNKSADGDSSDSMNAAGQTVAEPALGPSGLF